MVEKFIDPGFKVILFNKPIEEIKYLKNYIIKSFGIVTQVFAEMARVLSDSLIIPFNVTAYVHEMNVLIRDFKEEYGEALEKEKIYLNDLESAIEDFTNSAKIFQAKVKSLDKNK